MKQAKTEEAGKTLRPFVEALEAGDPIGHANLTLVPLRGPKGAGLDYALADEAIAAGALTVTEVGEAGRVPELLAENSGRKMVLLLDGEELVGAKQNRILNTSVLLTPGRTAIPVSCVEQGRWRPVSPEFRSGLLSPSSLRGPKSCGVTRNLLATGVAASNQGAVWDVVAETFARYLAAAPTMAMHDVYEQRRGLFDAYVEALKYPDGAGGVVAAINGRFVALDLFDQPATLQRVWPRLIGGYAMDAAAGRDRADASRTFTAKGAEALLERLGEIECRPCPSVGAGEDWRFESPDLVGQALVAEGVCVHLSAFPSEQPERGVAGLRSIQPPSQRRRGQPSGGGR